MPNFVSMQISTTVDETAGELRINVSGRDLLITSGQVINVFITEDGIRSDSQAGSDTTWTHNHVLREVLTPVWGAPLDVGEDGNYSFDAVWEIKDEITGPYATTPINLANINVVAFIGNHDAADPNRCEVFNAAVADEVFSSSTGIVACPCLRTWRRACHRIARRRARWRDRRVAARALPRPGLVGWQDGCAKSLGQMMARRHLTLYLPIYND